MRLWHLLVRQVYKSDNPENLIILKILVQTTVRGQSTQSTPNTLVVFVPTLWAGNLSAPICYWCRKRLPQAYMALN